MDSKFIPLAIIGLSWLTFKLIRIGRRDSTLPPGPPTIPILGNIHLLPRKFPFLRFTEWARVYGGIFSLKVADGTIIVVSDMTIVKELLEDRTSETSSRPSLYAADVITGKKYFTLANPDNHIWRMGRKAIQPLLAPQAVQAHLPVAEAETTQLLYDILHGPKDFCTHVSRSTLSFIASVVYGKSTPRYDSPEVTLFHEYMTHFSKAVSAGAAPVDLVPLLKYIPERWAPWKQLWRETRRLQQSLYFSFLEYAEQRVNNGARTDTFIENVLDRQAELGMSREMVAYIGGVLLDGGAEATSSIVQSLVLCLLKAPESLRRAQEDIDNVVGNNRLPLFSDLQALPYIQAMIKETHRMRPAGPLGIPHAATNDFQYRGYTIRKGTPILMNIWGIFHDPDTKDLFERPNDFWPDRYMLTHDGTKPGLSKDYSIRASLPFGGGKRLCPGMDLANTNSSLAVMRLLWAFDFNSVNDSAAQPTTESINDEYIDGISLSPKPFQCKVTPRDRDRIEIIENCYKNLKQNAALMG